MSDKIQIDLADRRLEANTDVRVPITIRFDKPTRVRGIHALFHGAEKTEAEFTTTSTDSEGKTQTKTETATEYFDLVRESFLLYGSQRKGFFGRLRDSLATWFGGGSHEIIQPGVREFSVNLKPPAHAPKSFKGKKCEVFYRLSVSVDLPIRMDWTETIEFEVRGPAIPPAAIHPVSVTFPDEKGRSFWDGIFGKPVTLNLALDRDTLAPGETVSAMLTVETPQPVSVNEIEAQLVGVEKTAAHGNSDSYRHCLPLGKVDSPGMIQTESVHEFNLSIPEIEGPYSQSGRNFDVSWNIEVSLKVPWAKDPVIRLPITLVPTTA